MKSNSDILYYDGACPLCSREIEKLKTHRKVEDLQCINIHDLKGESANDQRALLKTLHLEKADGVKLVGLDANIEAWRGTHYYKYWCILKLPLIHFIASQVYKFWAIIRFKKLYGKTL